MHFHHQVAVFSDKFSLHPHTPAAVNDDVVSCFDLTDKVAALSAQCIYCTFVVVLQKFSRFESEYQYCVK